LRFVVSHISQKTSEMWGTRESLRPLEPDLRIGDSLEPDLKTGDGLRPVIFVPRTLGRTWRTRWHYSPASAVGVPFNSLGLDSWMAHAYCIKRVVAEKVQRAAVFATKEDVVRAFGHVYAAEELAFGGIGKNLTRG
jgi:hypothetical protein